jgi:hypothetical protein
MQGGLRPAAGGRGGSGQVAAEELTDGQESGGISVRTEGVVLPGKV